MKAQGKYNFLLIHDDGATRSYRISRTVLRCVIIFLALLPLVSAAGLWAGWKAWEHGKLWTEEQQVLHRELVALRVQLTRLSNVEALMRLSETGQLAGEPGALPAAVMTRANTAATETAPTVPTTPSAPSTPGMPGTPNSAGTQNSASGTSGNPAGPGSAVPGSGSAGIPSLSPAGNPAVVNSSGAGDVPKSSTALKPPEPDVPVVEAVNPDLAVIDKGVVSLGNVSARLGDDRRVRVRLDLYNDSGQQVAGKIEYFIVTTDGHRTPLLASDTSFRISRLKKFVTSSLLPDSLSSLTNASLLVEVISAEGTRLFRQLYPISD